MKNKLQIGSILALIFMAIFFFLSLNPIFVVKPGERAIIFNSISGLKKNIYKEGFHFKTPFLDEIIYYNIRKRKITIPLTDAASKDLQTVKVELSFLFRPMPEKLVELYSTLGNQENYEAQLFPSIPQEIIKSVIATKTAEEVITERESVSQKIKEDLINRMKINNISIEEVAISDIQFSVAFTEAVERKQVALQDLVTNQTQAESTRVKAKAEADAAKMLNDSMGNSPNFVKLREIEAKKEIAKTLSGSSNVIYLPTDTVLMTNVDKKQ